MATDAQLTPMMAQYRRIKTELPKDALLLFRLGDFYEMFFEDAIEGAQLLNVALTKRGVIPMCGIPFHAANGYIAKILKAGRKVAVCDQMEEARPGQLVKREVTQILSPGTHFDERLLTAERNNFLAALNPIGKRVGLAVVDLTTGDFKVTELEGEPALETELERLRPAELIFPEEGGFGAKLGTYRGISRGYERWVFAAETAVFTLREHFKVASLDGFGLRERAAAIGAAGAALHYLAQHLRRDVAHLTRLSFYQASDFLTLDATTLKTLEVLEPLHAGGSSLFAAMNRTATPMGARRLRDWLALPLANVAEIHDRQDAVSTWMRQGAALEQFRAEIKQVRDLERTISRISVGAGNARDLQTITAGLAAVPCLRRVVEQAAHGEATDRLREEVFREEKIDGLLSRLAQKLTPMPELVELLGRALVDEPPLAIKEGGMIRDGYDPGLDELRSATRDGKDWIAKLQQDEITRTGISSLKVRFNSVFGYYIEITKTNLEKVPPEYIRKQTIANGERYITPALKEMEGKILGAEERSVKLEYEIFLKLREAVIGRLAEIQNTASALAELDVLANFAETARLFGHARPEVRDEGVLKIDEGRHPVLDQALVEERFVPNDTRLDL